MSKKILIIGGGISGLTAGVYAQKAGFEAHIFEQHSVPGGECTGWDRKGFHSDNCAHWMMGSSPGSELNELWTETGALGDVEILRADSMYTSELNGEEITLWHDIERTRREMLALSPEDKEEIEDLIKACKMAQNVKIPAAKPAELFGAADIIRMLLTTGKALKLFKKYENLDTKELMSRFKHPLLRCVISDFCTVDSLGYSFPMAYGNFVGKDGGIPRGGSRAMALRMQKRFLELGGHYHGGCRVEKILLEASADSTANTVETKGKIPQPASGLKLSDGQIITGDYIIPACDINVTFRKLLPDIFVPEMLKRMDENPEDFPIYNTFHAAFALHDARNLIGRERIMDCRQIQGMPFLGDRLTIKVYDYEPDFAPKGKQLVQAFLGGSSKMFEYWQKLYEDKEQYQAKKQELAGQIQKLLEQRFPECAGKLELLDTWTPMTYMRYCDAYKGFYQSFTVTRNSKPYSTPSAYVEGIPNLVLAGQWLNPPGGLPGAAIAGKYAVMRIAHLEAGKA